MSSLAFVDVPSCMKLRATHASNQWSCNTNAREIRLKRQCKAVWSSGFHVQGAMSSRGSHDKMRLSSQLLRRFWYTLSSV
jgi:hypothetical protein